jgi:general secretion pathway protein G
MTPHQVLPRSQLRSPRLQAGPFARGRPARGLTAPELLIAVTIIGVLAAIALPAYSNYQERIRVAQAITDIRDIAVKVQHYHLDNRAYPDDLAPVGTAGTLDPWGRPYQYMNLTDIKGKGKARKDKNLVPINSDFDLYSLGKDGASSPPLNAKASRDDVVRASDGRFVGLAADFDP